LAGAPVRASGSRGHRSRSTNGSQSFCSIHSIPARRIRLLFKQFGVGLAAAILIDATLVRGVLLPATMKLLGEPNWYLPRWLEWLPRFEFGEPSVAPEAPPTAAPA
jgi:putative drug exporter of the RND superfamily